MTTVRLQMYVARGSKFMRWDAPVTHAHFAPLSVLLVASRHDLSDARVRLLASVTSVGVRSWRMHVNTSSYNVATDMLTLECSEPTAIAPDGRVGIIADDLRADGWDVPIAPFAPPAPESQSGTPIDPKG